METKNPDLTPVQKNRIEKLLDLDVVEEREHYREYEYCIPLARAVAYGGSDLVYIANNEALEQEFPGVVTSFGDIDLESLEELSEQQFERLFDTLKGLESYPLIDEDTYSHMEDEQHEEYFNNYFLPDCESALENREDNPIEELSEELINWIKEFFYGEPWGCGDLIIEGESSFLVNHDKWVKACVETI